MTKGEHEQNRTSGKMVQGLCVSRGRADNREIGAIQSKWKPVGMVGSF